MYSHSQHLHTCAYPPLCTHICLHLFLAYMPTRKPRVQPHTCVCWHLFVQTLACQCTSTISPSHPHPQPVPLHTHIPVHVHPSIHTCACALLHTHSILHLGHPAISFIFWLARNIMPAGEEAVLSPSLWVCVTGVQVLGKHFSSAGTLSWGLTLSPKYLSKHGRYVPALVCREPGILPVWIVDLWGPVA